MAATGVKLNSLEYFRPVFFAMCQGTLQSYIGWLGYRYYPSFGLAHESEVVTVIFGIYLESFRAPDNNIDEYCLDLIESTTQHFMRNERTNHHACGGASECHESAHDRYHSVERPG